MAETTNVSKLIINYLTEDQYKTAKASGLINENELYVTDVQDSTTLDCFEELFTATEGQTLFTLTEGTYIPNQSRLTICVNGAQQPSTAYTETSSSSFTFDSGLSAGDSVIARYVNARIVSNIVVESHKTSHYSGGTDPLTPSDIGAASSTHTHGNIANGGAVGSTSNLPIFTGTNGLLETRTIEDAKTLLGVDAFIDADIGLTPAVATALGLTGDPQVKDALEAVNEGFVDTRKHYWSKKKYNVSFVNNGNNFYCDSGTSGSNVTIRYSSSYKVIYGVFTLISPTTITVGPSGTSPIGLNLTGKYIEFVSGNGNTANGYVGVCTSGFSYVSGTMYILYYDNANISLVSEETIWSYQADAYPVGDVLGEYFYYCIGSPQLIGVKIATGLYTGTGTYGSGSPNSLTFEGMPKILIISPTVSSGVEQAIMIINCTALNASIFNDLGIYIFTSGYPQAISAKKSADGKTISFYYTSDAGRQMNASGKTYAYTAVI